MPSPAAPSAPPDSLSNASTALATEIDATSRSRQKSALAASYPCRASVSCLRGASKSSGCSCGAACSSAAGASLCSSVAITSDATSTSPPPSCALHWLVAAFPFPWREARAVGSLPSACASTARGRGDSRNRGERHCNVQCRRRWTYPEGFGYAQVPDHEYLSLIRRRKSRSHHWHCLPEDAARWTQDGGRWTTVARIAIWITQLSALSLR